MYYAKWIEGDTHNFVSLDKRVFRSKTYNVPKRVSYFWIRREIDGFFQQHSCGVQKTIPAQQR